MFTAYPASLRHAILLTDGRNEHETPEQLTAAIGLCEGVFSCDCRGVGTDWEVGELRRISSALLGTVDIVPDPAGLAADFAAMMETAMGKQVADVSLRVWTPQHATHPVREAGRAGRRGPDRPADPVGPAGRRLPDRGLGRRREPRLPRARQVVPAAVGQEMLAARVSLVAGTVRPRGARPGPGPGDLDRRRGAVHPDQPDVAHYTGQAELAQVIQEGLEARKQGDEETATAKLGRAVALAEQSGNEARPGCWPRSSTWWTRRRAPCG